VVGVYIFVREDAKEPLRIRSCLSFRFRFIANGSHLGISRESTGDDPNLGSKRNELITEAAQKLADARMILFDHPSGGFTISDLGRIAAKYYIRHTSIERFNENFRPKMSEADILAMLCMSTEVSSPLYSIP
jgi:antiviral helicase SLH1